MSHTCSICLEVITTDLEFTPCAHAFHSACLREWLSRKAQCPVCKLDLTSASAGAGVQPRSNSTADFSELDEGLAHLFDVFTLDYRDERHDVSIAGATAFAIASLREYPPPYPIARCVMRLGIELSRPCRLCPSHIPSDHDQFAQALSYCIRSNIGVPASGRCVYVRISD